MNETFQALDEVEIDAVAGAGHFSSAHEFGDFVFTAIGAGLGGAVGAAVGGPFGAAAGAYIGAELTQSLFDHTHHH